jgi:phage terminase small subunit
MAVLKDIKYEKYAQNRFNGMGMREAAINAGFSEKSAHTQANKMEKRAEILIRIDELKQEAAEESILSMAEVLTALSEIAKDKNNPLKDRIKAYELIGQHHGAFTQNVNIGSTDIEITPVIFKKRK